MKVWNSTLERHTELRSKTGLRSSKPIRPVNRERKARLVERQYGLSFGYAEWIRSFDCAVPACHRDSRYTVCAHAAKTKGASGTWRDTVPLCWLHEDEWHASGRWTFKAKHGVDLIQLARALVRMWVAKQREEHGEDR